MKKLTVVYVSDIPQWGGSTLSMIDMIESLGDRIVPIVLVPAEGAVSKYMISHNIECHIVSYTLNTFLEQHRLFAAFHRPYAMARYCIKTREGCKKIEKIFKDRPIDIVHSNTSAIDFGYYVARICNAKHVWHIREMLDTFENTYSRLGYKSLKRKMSHADELIFISEACRSYWKINNQNNSVVLGDAVRSERDIVCYPTKEKYFVFCSQSLTKYKGCDSAIIAFGKSGLINKGYRLKIIGGYKKKRKEELDRLTTRYGIKDFVDFLDRLESNEIKRYMEKATAFLQCSKMEGLGRTAIEAMFYGCPVIARNCGGTLDFVIDGKTGYLWNNEDECSDLLIKVSDNNILSIIEAAQVLVAEKYNTEKYGDKVLGIYNKLA